MKNHSIESLLTCINHLTTPAVSWGTLLELCVTLAPTQLFGVFKMGYSAILMIGNAVSVGGLARTQGQAMKADHPLPLLGSLRCHNLKALALVYL
jgi:hypothetical protein